MSDIYFTAMVTTGEHSISPQRRSALAAAIQTVVCALCGIFHFRHIANLQKAVLVHVVASAALANVYWVFSDPTASLPMQRQQGPPGAAHVYCLFPCEWTSFSEAGPTAHRFKSIDSLCRERAAHGACTAPHATSTWNLK